MSTLPKNQKVTSTDSTNTSSINFTYVKKRGSN